MCRKELILSNRRTFLLQPSSILLCLRQFNRVELLFTFRTTHEFDEFHPEDFSKPFVCAFEDFIELTGIIAKDCFVKMNT